MKNSNKALSFILTTCILLYGCEDFKNEKELAQERFEALSKEWVIQRVTNGSDRTMSFKDPDFTITFSGQFDKENPRGNYQYSVVGSMPDPSPWKSSGSWSFADNPGSKILRDGNVEITYLLKQNELIMHFSCTDIFRVAETSSISGVWTFVFNAK